MYINKYTYVEPASDDEEDGAGSMFTSKFKFISSKTDWRDLRKTKYALYCYTICLQGRIRVLSH